MSIAPHAAVVRGDDYQFAIGWYWACQALVDFTIESVSLEDKGSGHFDDLVIVRQNGSTDYKQIKSSNTAETVITEKWLTTAVTASGKSPLQHFYATWQTLHTVADGAIMNFAIVTNRNLDHTNPILKLRDNLTTLVTGTNFANATPNSAIGKAKTLWAAHLGITVEELSSFLADLRFETEGGESSWDRQSKDAMRAAGLRADDDALARGKEIVRNWVKIGAGAQSVESIRQQIVEAELLARTGTLILAVDAIDRPSRTVVPNLTLDWVDLYDGDTGFNRRQLKDTSDWSDRLLPDLQSAARTLESYGLHRVHLTGAMRLPIWFALGTQLPRTRGWVLSLDQNGNEWSTATTPVSLPVHATESVLNLGTDLAIAIALSQDPTPDAIAYITENQLPVKEVLTIGVSNGPGMTSIADDAHALSWAASARDEIIQKVRATGATKIHLFMAAPAGAVMMLGYYWNMLPATLAYEHLGDNYAPTFTIQ